MDLKLSQGICQKNNKYERKIKQMKKLYRNSSYKYGLINDFYEMF